GTANFVHGFPVVGVSIGLVAFEVPIVAVVDAPMLGDTYSARFGGGAFRNGVPMSVATRDVERAICATGFPFRSKRDHLDDYLPVFTRALRTFEDLRRAGAASLDLCFTASGVLDGYFETGLGTWDVAAGGLLGRRRGGGVPAWTGEEGSGLWSGDFAAAPPHVPRRML